MSTTDTNTTPTFHQPVQLEVPVSGSRCVCCHGTVVWTEAGGRNGGWRCFGCIPPSRPDWQLDFPGYHRGRGIGMSMITAAGECIRLTQLDGTLPNLALMRLSHWHKARGDAVTFTRQAGRDRAEPDYDRVYGSAIFAFSAPKVARFMDAWPAAMLGGSHDPDNRLTVEDIIGHHDGLDYSLYPAFKPSIGFTQRGCRFNCGFCSVPLREGKARSVASVSEIWRGHGHPKQLHLLDNDFFGQAKADWLARISEIREGGFKACFNQGVNVRVISDEIAAALASVDYRDDQFQQRRLYTAWDSLGDEALFFRGIDRLEAAGVPPKHVRAYMLVGFEDKDETWERIQYRFQRMVDRGIEPFPMVYDCRATDPIRYGGLKRFQRWVVRGYYRFIPFAEFGSAPPAVTPRYGMCQAAGCRKRLKAERKTRKFCSNACRQAEYRRLKVAAA